MDKRLSGVVSFLSVISASVAIGGLCLRSLAEEKTELSIVEFRKQQGQTTVKDWLAQESENSEEEEVVITGDSPGSPYREPSGSTATRTETPLHDIPQSIQVIPRQVIEDQQPQRISDVLRNASGVTPRVTYSTPDTYTIRGFNTDDNLRNGFRQNNFTNFTDPANIERIEVLKGPGSVLYGQLEPGGIVNYITKQPLSEPFYSGQFSVGSYQYYRPSIDISGPLTEDKSLLYRLNLAYETSRGFRDFARREVYLFAPSFTHRISSTTSVNIEYEYLKVDQNYDRGLLPIAESFNLPISFNFGEPSDDYNIFSNRFSFVVNHQLSSAWKIRSGLSFQIADTERKNVQPIDFSNPFDPDGRTVQRRYNEVEDYSRDLALQTDFIGTFKTGNIAHQLLLGVELGRSVFGFPFRISFDVAPLDFLNPVYGAAIPTTFDEGNEQKSTTNRVGLYVQDQITLLPNLKLLAGGRFDFVRFRDEFTPDIVNGSEPEITRRTYNVFSPRVGLVYQPIPQISLYASYSQSFKPDAFAVTVDGTPLEPERATQYEAGIKGEFLNGRLAATLAFYDITKKNVATTDINNPDFSIAAGEVKSRGIEFDIAGEILPGWNLIASYFINDAFISQDNSLPTGDRLVNAPRNGGSLWTTYEIQRGRLKGLGIGAGIFFVGDREATLPNTIEIPSYIRTDATVFYRQPNYQIALTLKNLFDKKYYDSQGFLLTPGAPLTVIGSVSFKF
ncbi:TonB-dependent siderophore receptor [Leptolyngbya sp. NIES-3755]|nr:TonB-dependent siderophore receptor [Leptolyngbya sp. NIES-3755]